MSVVVALATGTAVTGSAAAVAVEPEQTTTTGSLSTRKVYVGEPVTATATVSAATGVPSGSITFTVVGTRVVETTVPLVNGVATLVLEDLDAGLEPRDGGLLGSRRVRPVEGLVVEAASSTVVEFVPPVLTRSLAGSDRRRSHHETVHRLRLAHHGCERDVRRGAGHPGDESASTS